MADEGTPSTPAGSEGRSPGLGWPEPRGSLGIDRRLELLDGIVPLRGSHVLDIGCGNGSYTERLADTFDHIAGVEVEAERLAEFQGRVAARHDSERFDLRLESAEALGDADATYDAVVAFETLDHVVDLEAAVAEVSRVLRPGGCFFVTVANRGFPFDSRSVLRGGPERQPRWYPLVPWGRPRHQRMATAARRFRPADLQEVLGGAGLRELGTTFMMPPLEGSGPGRYLRRPVTALERSPLRQLGVSLVAVYERPAVVADATVDLRDGRPTETSPQASTGARRPVATS